MPAEITRVSPEDTARSFGIGHYRAAYARGVNVSQLLEQDDPTSERPADERHLDAFERVLRAAGLRARPVPEVGTRASTWEEATSTPERRALMPEFCARVWRNVGNPRPQQRALMLSGDNPLNTIANQYDDAAGLRAPALAPPISVNSVIARTSAIDGDAYRSMYLNDSLGTDAYRMKRVAEGAQIPATTIVTGEHTLRLYKFARALRATYEQLRRQPLDRIAFMVARMRLQAEVDKVSMVLAVVVSGDGNANTSATVYTLTSLDSAAVAGTLTLKGWLNFKLGFTAAYSPTAVLGQLTSISQLLLLPVLTNTNQLPLVMATGAFGDLRPFNSENRLAQGERYGITSDAPALKLVVFDPSIAVERVTEIGGEVSEMERFINNQTTMLTLSEVEGYGIIDPLASRILDINA